MSEIYVQLVVGFPRDPKVRALASYGPDGNLARDLYVQMLLFCKESLTDGFVPDVQVGALVYPISPTHGNQLAKQLASVGLINPLCKDGAEGWQIAAWLKRNKSREEVERLSAIRAASGRKGGSRSPGEGTRQAPANQVAKQVAYQGAEQAAPHSYRGTEKTPPPSPSRPSPRDALADAGSEEEGEISRDLELEALVDEIRADHPGWTRDDIRAELIFAEESGRSRPVVAAAARACYALERATSPGLLRTRGPWWNVRPARPASTRPPWCGECRPDTRERKRDDGTGSDPCPECHPSHHPSNATKEAS